MSSKAPEIAKQLLEYLEENNALEELVDIVNMLEKESFRRQDITVVSAVAIGSEEKTELERVLREKWGEHDFVYTVDLVLKSGIIARFQNQVIDTSGKNQLRDLAEKLTK